MQIYNTLSRKKEKLQTIEPGKITIYVCGPTVYNYFHLGNARPLVNFDTFRRYLEYKGYDVNYVLNFTDIDDKVINRANEEGKTIREVSDFYIEQYFTDADGLNVKRATTHPRATDYIDGMLVMIQGLIDKGFAYIAEDGVYYEVAKFKDYLKLSGFNKNELMANVRVDVNSDNGKKDPADFVLWKFKKENEPYWESPWGDGRPGWHIECSVMSTHNLGDTFDIHCGGRDLIFPHHENEIAQSEAYTGQQFANNWMHNGFITVDDEKMSKSEGNFFLVRQIADEYGYMPIRIFLLNTHYRNPVNYSIDMIGAAKSAYERIANAHKNLEFIIKQDEVFAGVSLEDAGEQEANLLAEAERAVTHFEAAMDDDINTADALGAIFDLVKEANIALKNPTSREGLARVYTVIDELSDVLGLAFAHEGEVPEEVLELVKLRDEAKAAKDYAQADAYRDQIASLGYNVIDTAQGAKVEVLD